MLEIQNKVRFQRGRVHERERLVGSGGCVITAVPGEDLSESLSQTDVQETTPGKELREHKLKCEHSGSQKSKER